MTLNIVRLSGLDGWKVYTFKEGEYRETPKQFKFTSDSRYFNHVDKDLEGVYSNDGYIYSRTLSVEELKERLVDHRLGVWKNKYEDAKERFDKYRKIKDNL